MEREHWIFLLAIAMMLGLMLFFALEARPKSRLYRGVRRIFWAFMFIHAFSAVGLLGMNGVNLMMTAVLGWPGAAALALLSAL